MDCVTAVLLVLLCCSQRKRGSGREVWCWEGRNMDGVWPVD